MTCKIFEAGIEHIHILHTCVLNKNSNRLGASISAHTPHVTYIIIDKINRFRDVHIKMTMIR